MSQEIEYQLNRIANALETLVGQGNHLASDIAPIIQEVKAEEPTATATATATPEPVQTFTHADLKAACLFKSRENVANKPKLKALLAEYGANKAVDIKEDKLKEVINKIEKGEF
jgi:hypothetical protein